MVAVVFFVPWAVEFAVHRGALRPATVCRADGNRLDGVLVGETPTRVYIGEIPNRIVIFLKHGPLERDVEGLVRAAGYDVRVESEPTKTSFARVGVAIIDVAKLQRNDASKQIARLYPAGTEEDPIVPVIAYSPENTEPPVSPAPVTNKPEPPPLPDSIELASASTLRDPDQLLPELKADVNRPQAKRPDLRITSVPNTQVSRVLIGTLGPCPAVKSPG
jgi:hypothetical protein